MAPRNLEQSSPIRLKPAIPWSASLRIYGDDPKHTFQDIYEANKDLIGDDPDQIKVGMTLRIPAKKINKII